MKLSVCSGRGSPGREAPEAFYLNQRRLGVAAILKRWTDEAACACFEVRVPDGRHFVLRHVPDTGAWELTAVYRPAAGR
jgi:hypothetical protein